MKYNCKSVILELIVFNIFFAYGSDVQSIPNDDESITSAMFPSMDTSVKPCDNFYQHVCGNYKNELGNLTNENIRISRFIAAFAKISKYLMANIQKPISLNEKKYITTAKKFYQVCMNPPKSYLQTLASLENYQMPFKHWPIREPKNYLNNFSWANRSYRFPKKNLSYYLDSVFLNIKVAKDIKNSKKYAIYVKQPSLGFSQKSLLNRDSDSDVKYYFQHIINIASCLEVDYSENIQPIFNLVQFEKKLANIINYTESYNPMTIKELIRNYSFFPWRYHFSHFLGKNEIISDDQLVYVDNLDYIHKLEILVANSTSTTLANYVMWRTIKSSSSYLGSCFRNEVKNFKPMDDDLIDNERSDECFHRVSNNFPLIMSALFFRGNLYEEDDEKYMRVESKFAGTANKLKREFQKYILGLKWLKTESKLLAIEKIRSMDIKISHPRNLKSEIEINEYYHDFKFFRDDDFLMSIMSVKFFDKKKMWMNLRNFEKSEKNMDWIYFGKEVHRSRPLYDRNNNYLIIPAGLIKSPLFHINHSNSTNFVEIRALVGVVMALSLINETRPSINEESGFLNWHSINETEAAYNDLIQCFVTQFNNNTISLNAKNVNYVSGNFDTYAAESIGVKLAYRARDQMESSKFFFTSAMNAWCSYPLENEENLIKVNSSSVAHQIARAISNMKEFSDAYNCPANTTMNPSVKCHL